MIPTARALDRPGPRRVRRALTAAPRALARVRRDPPGQETSLAVLVALSVLLLVGDLRLGVDAVPPSAFVVPLLLGGLLLGRRALLRLVGVVAVLLVAVFVADAGSVAPQAPLGAVVVVALTAVFAWDAARARDETGLGATSGDTVLVELRARLEQQGRLPALPAGWSAEAVVRPAGGGPFAGDFVVSARTGDRLEVALVDVSGKGVGAGTRALLLSGAMGGLLGGPVERFLGSANDYLVRQDWEEGFATAVHLVVDLSTGGFAVRSAGHPPVAHLDAGTGRWALLDAGGPALGLLPDQDYAPVRGRLDEGDALLLYTDGLVETPGRDLSVGIDGLLGEAERLVTRGFRGGAEQLVVRTAGSAPDDRGLVLLWRG